MTSAERVLRPDLDLAGVLDEVVESGAAFTPRALGQRFLEQLAAEAATLDFIESEPLVGGRVRQEAAACVVQDHQLGAYPALGSLREQLARELQRYAAHVPGLTQWSPTEVCVQRYQPGSVGIGPHLDHKRYARLVAIVTASGAAEFTLCRNREGDPIQTWTAGPGSLVLLRGPGLVGLDDGRPLHAVAGPTNGVRLSVGIRMDIRQLADT